MAGFINTSLQGNYDYSRMNREAGALNSLNKSLADTSKIKDKRLMEAAQQFESVFVHQLLQVMDKTIERSEFMKGGHAEDMFRDMFYQEIAKDISTNPATSFGLAKQVYEQLAKYE